MTPWGGRRVKANEGFCGVASRPLQIRVSPYEVAVAVIPQAFPLSAALFVPLGPLTTAQGPHIFARVSTR